MTRTPGDPPDSTDSTRPRGRDAGPAPGPTFGAFGVEDGGALLDDALERMDRAGRGEFEPTDAWFAQLDRSFRSAFVAAADVPVVPPAVGAALDDALHFTAREFADPGADARRDVLPALYLRAGEFYRAYLDDSRDPGPVTES